MSALDFGARALAAQAAATNPQTFLGLSGAQLPASVQRLESIGYAIAGIGAGTYICDDRATADLLAKFPKACFRAGDGRIFRLIADAAGNITPEQTGCPAYAPGVNAQPALQAAYDYAAEMGYGVMHPQASYEVWAPGNRPDGLANFRPQDDLRGYPLIIRKSLRLIAGPAGTTFHRRLPGGLDPAVFGNTPKVYQADGKFRWFRGGMFVVFTSFDNGSNPAVPLAQRPTLAFQGNWVFNGGIPQSGTNGQPGIPGGNRSTPVNNTEYNNDAAPGQPSYFALRPDGSGWDMTDKFIWKQNTWTGDLVFDGDITITGFRGEVIYLGGTKHGSFYQRGKLTFRHCDADAMNLADCQTTRSDEARGETRAQHLYFQNVYQPFESGTGLLGGTYGHIEAEDCGPFYLPKPGAWTGDPPTVAPTPIALIEKVTATRCDRLNLSMYQKITRIDATDTQIVSGQAGITLTGTSIGEIVSTCDSKALNNAVSISGTIDLFIGTLRIERTAAAKAAGRGFTMPVNWNGGISGSVVIGRIVGDHGQAPQNSSSTVTGSPAFLDMSGLQCTVRPINVEPNSTIAADTPPYVQLTPQDSGTTQSTGMHMISLPNAQASQAKFLPAGARWRIKVENNRRPVSIVTANTSMTRRFIIPANMEAEFRWTGAFWEPITGYIPLTGGTASVALQKAGAAIPAGDVSDEIVLTVNGAKVGMLVMVSPVNAGFPADAQLIGRVTADNTVGIRARNLNMASALPIAANQYRVRLEWQN